METVNPHYEKIGGEPGVRKLVEVFYHIMDTHPMATGIRQLHPENLDSSKEKLFMFLSGWLGGPPLYIEAYGHPRLRQRHLPFPIGDAERDQWMECMREALRQCDLDEELRQQLTDSFSKTADFLRNQE
ncbi:group II truncated hemoglobin [Ferrovum sp.]|jgi:hemoglobin|uniref:group II truncated hemoglobin n=1 Tax=Ferrovum sp. TaxID=2609467 RepID=UPI002620BA4C|nr:group II truncated hemoglobin [Ferrovum sp.]